MARVRVLIACCVLAFSVCAESPDRPAESRPVLRADCDLVLIPVHVTTTVGRSVTTLRRTDFRLSDDNVEQAIQQFSHEDAPVSIGLLFDTSGSMRTKMQKASEAAAAFFKTSNRGDEFFLVEFNNRARLTVPFTSDQEELYQEIVHARTGGRTALLDAIYVSVKQMKNARNSRKALVIVSDGGDNWSRHKVREVRNDLLESDIQVYAIGIFDRDESARKTREEKEGPELLSELAEQSGGRHYPVDNLNDLPAVSTQLGIDLHDEYLLGFSSSNPSRDGKYHKVRVNLTTTGEFRIYHRRGYYAPSE
jgi:Ca-activated chloride channel family protein